LAPDRTGASLTAVTLIDEVAVAVLKAVTPPFVEASTLLPDVPLVWSQARKVTEATVAFWPSGTNRNLSVDRSNSAEASDTAPTLVQMVPPSVEYCHAPVLLLKPVTAMPETAPLSTSETCPEINVETKSPLFVV